jgi:Ca2+-binding EF-hand superfamily protein
MAAKHSFSIEELQKLNAVFSAADYNKDGGLNKEEFQRLIENTIGVWTRTLK